MWSKIIPLPREVIAQCGGAEGIICLAPGAGSWLEAAKLCGITKSTIVTETDRPAQALIHDALWPNNKPVRMHLNCMHTARVWSRDEPLLFTYTARLPRGAGRGDPWKAEGVDKLMKVSPWRLP